MRRLGRRARRGRTGGSPRGCQRMGDSQVPPWSPIMGLGGGGRAGGRRGAPGVMVRSPCAAVRGRRGARSVAEAALCRCPGGGAGRRHARRATAQGARASVAAGGPYPTPNALGLASASMVYLVWLLILLLPYWLGPMIVWLTQKAGARPVFEPFTAGRHSVPEDVAASLQQTCDTLGIEGFHVVADLFQTGQMKHVSTRVALLENSVTAELA